VRRRDCPAVTTDDSGRLSPESRRRLLDAIDAYNLNSSTYDEVFLAISDRINDDREAGKLDLAALILWKRSGQGSWVKDLLATPEGRVREVTREAFATAGDLPVLRALESLPGFKSHGPIATALMAAKDPYDWGVLDVRAINALASLGRSIGPSRGKTLRYLTEVRRLRDDLATERPEITAREIDKGLWWLDKHQPPRPSAS
jgi:hypothetical protein